MNFATTIVNICVKDIKYISDNIQISNELQTLWKFNEFYITGILSWFPDNKMMTKYQDIEEMVTEEEKSKFVNVLSHAKEM